MSMDRRRFLRGAGGALVALTWFLPLAGWFGMLPLSLATGVGCGLMALRGKKEDDAA